MGRYLTLCGIDGCGKSSQVNMLADKFRWAGYHVVMTREPGSPLLPFNVRDLLTKVNSDISPIARELLFEADRAQHCYEISKLVQQFNTIIISDRSFISGLAYAQACGFNKNDLTTLMRIAINGVYPEHIVVVDLPAEIAEQRRLERGGAVTHEESKGLAFMETVRQNFLQLQEAINSGFPNTIYTVVDGLRSKEEIHNEIWNIVK